ncbi:MAG: helix-turn-helix domain-containing protein [Thermoleophilaceae bacterium]
MATVSSRPEVGPLLRQWRERRRRTQQDLALDAGISARHLSFVETGRSKPGAEIILRLAEQLDVPFRERNDLLLAAGHAPAFPERSLEDPELASVRDALELILTEHEPYPAVVVDRHWNLVAANSAMGLVASLVEPDLLSPPVNVMRVGLHPRGLAPSIVNLDQVRAYFITRLQRQVAVTADAELAALLEEVAGYPARERDPPAHPADTGIAGPVRIRAPDGAELSFFGMFATFETPFEVTTSELAIEFAFPADRATAEALTNLARDRR